MIYCWSRLAVFMVWAFKMVGTTFLDGCKWLRKRPREPVGQCYSISIHSIQKMSSANGL